MLQELVNCLIKMEIPKVKVLIYVLTFLGYAWSGYGSGILLNVRDAILSAEKFFGDFLGNVIEFGKKFRNVPDILDAALEEKCKFSCPTGGTPVKNRYHKPSADGCGTDLLKFDIKKYIPATDLTLCCDKHDICYDTCNNKKDDCDSEFHTCLYKLCDKIGVNNEIMKACKAAAKLMSTSTMTFGCKSYLESQNKACYCPPEDKKKRKYTTGNEL